MQKNQNKAINIAKEILNNKGCKKFQTKLSETDFATEKIEKKFGPFKYHKYEYVISEKYAKQIIIIDTLYKYKEILNAYENKLNADKIDKAKDYDNLLKTIYTAINVYNFKLDNSEYDGFTKELLKICSNKIIYTNRDYGSYKFEPFLLTEQKYVEFLLKYNRVLITKYQEKDLNIEELKNKIENKEKDA